MPTNSSLSFNEYLGSIILISHLFSVLCDIHLIMHLYVMFGVELIVLSHFFLLVCP